MNGSEQDPPLLTQALIAWLDQAYPSRLPRRPTDKTHDEIMWLMGRRALVDDLIQIYNSQQGGDGEE